MQIFVTGTDTDVGKTVITAGLAAVMQSLGYKAGVYKPFQTGAEEKNGFLYSPDLAYVKHVDNYIETRSTYLFETPAAPYVSALAEGVQVNLTNITHDFQSIKQNCEVVLVEGAGGLMVPVYSGKTMADIAKLIETPILIIARPDLGTINHTLLTINYAKSIGLDIAGVIINKFPEGTDDIAIRTVPRLLEEYTDASILGIVPYMHFFEATKPGELINVLLNSVDIEKIFRIKIPKLNLSL